MRFALIVEILAQESEAETGGGIDLLLPASEELIAGVIAFSIIFFVVWKWALPVFSKTLEARSQAIRDQFEQAEAAKQEAESLRSDYQDQLAGAGAEASKIVEEARESGDKVKADIVARAEAEAEQLRARARDEIASERSRVAGELQRQVAALSLDVAAKVIGETLDRDQQQELVDRYIDELGGVQ